MELLLESVCTGGQTIQRNIREKLRKLEAFYFIEKIILMAFRHL